MSTYIIGEIGQNHNGSVDIAKLIVDLVSRPVREEVFNIELRPMDAVKLTKRDLNEELTDSQLKVFQKVGRRKSSVAIKRLFYSSYIVLKLLFKRQTLLNIFTSVDYRGVIARKSRADGGQSHFGMLFGKIHHHLTRV